MRYRISYVLEGPDADVSDILEAAEQTIPDLRAQLEALDVAWLCFHEDGPLVETLP